MLCLLNKWLTLFILTKNRSHQKSTNSYVRQMFVNIENETNSRHCDKMSIARETKSKANAKQSDEHKTMMLLEIQRAI